MHGGGKATLKGEARKRGHIRKAEGGDAELEYYPLGVDVTRHQLHSMYIRGLV